MDNSERKVFDSVIEKLIDQYPKRNIEIIDAGYGDEFVNIDGRTMFNISGYNLLFNLKRLCDCLAGELV